MTYILLLVAFAAGYAIGAHRQAEYVQRCEAQLRDGCDAWYRSQCARCRMDWEG